MSGDHTSSNQVVITIYDWPDPIHDERPNDLLWSRANVAEAIPGVVTALTWTFWANGFARANRDIWLRLGLLSRAEAAVPQGGPRADDDFVSIFYGRPVVNVDMLRSLFGRMPGGDPDQVELQFLGTVRDGVTTPTSRRRWPVLALRAPRQLLGLDRKAAAMRSETDAWWRHATRPERFATVDAARCGLSDAVEQFNRIQLVHGLSLMMGQIAFEQVGKLCAAEGKPDLALDLASTGDDIEESHMLDDLWNVADGRESLDDFLADHGYHGPDEGALHNHSWREDAAPLHALIERYRTMPDRRRSGTAQRRAAAETNLLAGMSCRRRMIARRTLRMADRAIPRREVTKAAFLQAVDAARFATRSMGAHLATAGTLDHPDDIFHYTLTEALTPDIRIPKATIAERRAVWESYRRLDIPSAFQGNPKSRPTGQSSPDRPADEPEAGGFTLHGIGAGGGTADGIARIVSTADQLDILAPGEILICTQTDPAWVPFFEIAGAVAVEIGGPLSHAAIVAREMGVPCVVGVQDATTRIADGSNVRVDGTAGTVHVNGNP